MLILIIITIDAIYCTVSFRKIGKTEYHIYKDRIEFENASFRGKKEIVFFKDVTNISINQRLC
jgi:hypothetical protein